MFFKVVKRMKGSRSLGRYLIDSYSIKLTAPILKEGLKQIINLSLVEKKFASRWTHSLLLPQHKKGDREDPSNYRPVSNLVEIGKMVEYAIYL